MAKPAPREATITDWLAAQKEAMLALLAEAVNMDSGSYDKAGVDAVGARFIRFFAEQGLVTTVEPHERFGNAIHIRLDDKPTNERPIVLMGHRDTVFPKGEVERRPFRIEGNRAYGPGVVDMKAGLVLNAFVLAAFKRFGGAPAPLAGLITSDEEIASPSSRPVIERVGRAARCVFNSEPGRPSGNIVTSRKGGVFLSFEVTGKAAHSGGNFEKGISAIGELAHKIVALHKLTDLKRGITVNVGLVKGGQSVNTTAPLAEGQIDLRYVKPEQRAPALAALQAIIDSATVPGTSAKLDDQRRVPARDGDAGGGRAVPLLPGGRRRCRLARRGRVLRWLRQLWLHGRRRLPDAVRRGPGRRQRPHARGIPGGRHPGAARAGHGAGDPAHASCGRAKLISARGSPRRLPFLPELDGGEHHHDGAEHEVP